MSVFFLSFSLSFFNCLLPASSLGGREEEEGGKEWCEGEECEPCLPFGVEVFPSQDLSGALLCEV